MDNFQPTPTLLRSHALFDLIQSGADVVIKAKSSRVSTSGNLFTVAEIEANPIHFQRGRLPALRKAGAVAFVEGMVDGKIAQLTLSAEQWARGAEERQRYATWRAETSREIAAGRAYWDGINEGGEGFNPYRR